MGRVLILLLAMLVPAGPAGGAPAAELWPRWLAHQPGAAARIDHGDWDRFLADYVVPDDDGINRVAYGRVAAADRRTLDAYIGRLSATPIDGFDRPEQLAFWINLYNALTVKVVLDHYPVESIRDIDISPGLFVDGPWGATLATVAGEALSLDDIEHRILRPIWRDPRIHYAVNCAALGCPNLQARAFTGANAEAMLDDAARSFVNHPRGARVAGGDLLVSRIYEWFVADFGGDDAGVIAHLAGHAAPDLAAALAGRDSIDGTAYDWALNDIGAK